jgi:hypothetical protein
MAAVRAGARVVRRAGAGWPYGVCFEIVERRRSGELAGNRQFDTGSLQTLVNAATCHTALADIRANLDYRRRKVRAPP